MTNGQRRRKSDALHVAIDLGAGSGRALVGGAGPTGLRLTEVHRFHYTPRRVDGHLRWDIGALTEGVRAGLQRARAAAESLLAPIVSIGVDSWAVDYALLDAEGHLLEDPICYRDERTADAIDEVLAVLPREEIYARTGIQFQQFNTLYQLWAHVRDGLSDRATHLLLMPDFCHHLLCGSLVSERTNASTTQLLDARTGRWDEQLFDRLHLPRHLMPDIVAAGTALGTLRPELGGERDVAPVSVIAPGTHDTASAVAGTPLAPGWAFISSGTWSLVGVERNEPLLSEAAARANLTNESGVFGSVHLLANVMGLWLLESCRREWEAEGRGQDLPSLLRAVARVPESAGVVFPDDRRFFTPSSMVSALRVALTDSGQADTNDPVLLTKLVLDSLALRYGSVVDRIEQLTGQAIKGLHVVGGGSQNDYLNQATANASGRPVLAGQVEATATGNVLVQAITTGELASLEEGRRLLGGSRTLRRFEPRDRARWVEASKRYRDLEAQHSRYEERT
ncbi:MAG: rhamnulokinase [Acidobacteria bacterium]|nr:rhamnulokinase [Acidobacteriota bacterium]